MVFLKALVKDFFQFELELFLLLNQQMTQMIYWLILLLQRILYILYVPHQTLDLFHEFACVLLFMLKLVSQLVDLL